MSVANIGRKDLLWSLLATMLKLGAGIFLFPFILNRLPDETVGIWTIFTTITALTHLLDFGFKSSFSRNVAYVFSGVRQLQKQGFQFAEDTSDDAIDYNLLKSIIRAMRHFYSRMALVLLFLFLIVGTPYIHFLLDSYTGDKLEIYVAWVILCVINTYNLFTFYYEALLHGAGYVKSYNQYTIVGNLLYVSIAALLMLLGFGIISIVSAQSISVIVVRWLAFRRFFSNDMRRHLDSASDSAFREVLNAVSPNAVKVGLTSLGGFIINRAATFVGSLYVPLSVMASYGITLQLINVMTNVGIVYSAVYMPKVYQWRVENNIRQIGITYLRSVTLLVLICLSGGIVMYYFGNWALNLMHSSTMLLSGPMLIAMLIFQFLEMNHANAADYLLSKNEVPFFRASLISAASVLILLLLFVVVLHWGVWGMILAPGITQLCYQNWRWPYLVIRELFFRK